MKGWACLTGGTGRQAPAPDARWAHATRACLRSPRQRLALAFAASLVLHLAVLSTMRGGRGAGPEPRVLLVTLAPDAPVAPVASAAADVRQPQSQPAAPQASDAAQTEPSRPSAPSGTTAPSTAGRPAPAASAGAEAAPSSSSQRARSGPASGDRVARPLGLPLLDADLRRELVARKLALRVSVEPDGSASQVTFNNPELSAAALAALREAILRVRFEPALRDGQASPAAFETRLCFDDDGRFDDGPPDCWRAPQR